MGGPLLVEEALATRFLGPAAGQGHEVTMGQSARPTARPRRGGRGTALPVPEAISRPRPGEPVRPARKRARGA